MVNSFYDILLSGLQGNMTKMLSDLSRLKDNEIDDSQTKIMGLILNRFNSIDKVEYKETDDCFLNQIVTIHQNLWKNIFLKTLSKENAENNFFKSLKELINEENDDALKVVIRDKLQKSGFKINIFGKTENIYDLFIWKNEEEKIIEVELPESKIKVTVNFLNDFILTGWFDYVTGGVYYAGGWATKEKLFCIKKAYDLESEFYKVGYLVHEAQHFSDYKQFPNLIQKDLEYRAKLSELIMSDKVTHILLNRFLASGSNTSNSHSYAEYCIMKALSKNILSSEYCNKKEMWEKVSSKSIKSASLKLLNNHTQSLNKIGKIKVKEVI